MHRETKFPCFRNLDTGLNHQLLSSEETLNSFCVKLPIVRLSHVRKKVCGQNWSQPLTVGVSSSWECNFDSDSSWAVRLVYFSCQQWKWSHGIDWLTAISLTHVLSTEPNHLIELTRPHWLIMSAYWLFHHVTRGVNSSCSCNNYLRGSITLDA